MPNFFRAVFIFFAVIAAWTSVNAAGAAVVDLPPTVGEPLYPSSRAPLAATPFVKLPVGAIRPGGWLRKQMELQRDGLAGHLDEISPWLGKTDNAWLDKAGKGKYGWEELPYWLKGYVRMAYALNDADMIAKSQFWIDNVLNNQRPDGDFGPLIVRKGKRDLWAQMPMLDVLQSYYEATHDRRVLPFMTKYFQWQLTIPDADFLKNFWENSRGGDNLESVYWLYDRTGDAFLLDLATKIDRNTADWRQASDGTLPNWHGVNIAECFREPATYALQSGNHADIKATDDAFALVRKIYGQVPGGMYGADENCRKGYYDPRQGSETCAMVEQLGSDGMLLQWTGDARWADNMENVAFNTFPAALTADMKALRYLTAPNLAISDSKNHSPGVQNRGPFFEMNPFSNRCCQHNHSNGWPNYLDATWMATPDHGLAAQLYCATTVVAKVGNNTSVTIESQTKYPFEPDVSLTVNSASPAQFPLYLRIPTWIAADEPATVSVNGQPVPAADAAGKYVKIDRTWNPGDRVAIHLPMQLHVHMWSENESSVSVGYGPLTFSLDIAEKYVKQSSTATAIKDSGWQKTADQSKWPSYEILPQSPWNYGLIIDPAKPGDSVSLLRKPWPSDDDPFGTDQAPIVLQAKGKKLPDWGLDKYELIHPLPQSPQTADTPTTNLTLVPMGSARLRVSAFPRIAS